MSKRSQQNHQKTPPARSPAPVAGPVPPHGAESVTAVVDEAEKLKIQRAEVEARYAKMLADAGDRIAELEKVNAELQEKCRSMQCQLDAVVYEAEDGTKPYLEIRSATRAGFWRCGYHFTLKPTYVPVEGTDPKVVERLMQEGHLSVRQIRRKDV